MTPVSRAPWFDVYVMVDWSSSTRPKLGADSIWLAYVFWDGGKAFERQQRNLPTRQAAMDYVDLIVRDCLAKGLRLMLGFDFPFSYPAGAGAAAGGVLGYGPQWSGIWRCLQAHILDGPNNANNRFAVADMLNKESGIRFFWGRPQGGSNEHLSSLPPRDLVPTGLRANPCGRLRLTETLAGGARPVWQLYGNGSVGGQALVGLPRLEQLRRAYPEQVAVWPFDTGLSALRADYQRPVTLVEIWPGAVSVDRDLGSVRDEAQVRSLVRWCAIRDARGDWGEWLAPASATSAGSRVFEEGWILGVR